MAWTSEPVKDIRQQPFPGSARLRQASDFSRVFSKPVVSSDSCFRVFARHSELGCSRLGLAVSRKVDKRAVGRNRIKRIVRESFRRRVDACTRSGKTTTLERRSPEHSLSADIVVLPSRRCASISNPALFQSLEQHWIRLERKLR